MFARVMHRALTNLGLSAQLTGNLISVDVPIVSPLAGSAEAVYLTHLGRDKWQIAIDDDINAHCLSGTPAIDLVRSLTEF